MIFPLRNRIVGGYKYWQKTAYSPHHLGTDYRAKLDNLYAPLSGKITSQVKGKEGGNTLILECGRYSFRFLHLDHFIKKTGDLVKEGDLIAVTGNTGLGVASDGTLTDNTVYHSHIEVWNGKVNLNDFSKTIDPEDFFSDIRVLVIGDKEYDLKDLLAENPFINITQNRYDVALVPKWITNSKGERIIDPVWGDFNLATYGFDIVAFVTKNYERANTIGYAPEQQRLGNYRCFIRDTGEKRGTVPNWRRDNQIAGTLEHEIQHILYHGCNLEDKTHELDKGLGFPFLPLKKFKGWEIPGTIRLFKRKPTQILERDVKTFLFNASPKLWEKFGFIDTI